MTVFPLSQNVPENIQSNNETHAIAPETVYCTKIRTENEADV